MTYKEILARAKGLYEQAVAIFQNPDATAEEKEQAEAMFKEAEELKAKGLRLKQILDGAMDEAMTKALEESRVPVVDGAPTPAPAPSPASPADAGAYKEWNEFLYAIWMRKAHQVSDSRLKFFKDEKTAGHEEKQMVESTGASGGFLVPVQFLPSLQAIQAEDSIVRANGPTVIRMTNRQLAIPVLDQTGTTAGLPHWFGGMRFYWQAEASEKTLTEPSFRKVNLVAHKLIGYTYASDELLDDSAISLADFLSGPLGFAGGVAWMEDYAFLMGTGAGQPRGVVNAPATIGVNRAAANAVGVADLANMLQAFLPSGRGVWVMSQSVMASMIQLAGPTGNASYFWQPSAREGLPPYLLGFPVMWSEKVPALGTRGDVGLYDFRYFIIGDRQATTIDTTPYDRWEYDETSWRVVHRVDGQPWLSTPLTLQDGTTQISPFVVLDDVDSS